jgi:hypothetical protein
MNVPSSIIYENPKLETNVLNLGTEGQNERYLCNGMLFSARKKEQSTDSAYHTDTSQKLTKKKKLDTKDDILYDSIY